MKYKTLVVKGDWIVGTHTTTETEGGGLFAKEKTVVKEEKVTQNNLVDVDDMALKIEIACNSLSDEGFEVISVLPIQQGCWRNDTHHFANTGWYVASGAGYSPTVAVVITARNTRA